MSDTNSGAADASAADASGPAALKPAEATEDAKKENNSISKSPAKSKTVNETVAEAKKSPAKARDEKKSAGEINGEEVLKSDKPADKAAPEESQKDVPPVKSDKQSPSKQTDKPKADEEGPAEEDMEVTQSEQSEDPAPSTPATQRRKRSSAGDAQAKTPATPRESARKRTRSPSVASSDTPSDERTKRQRRQVEKFQANTPTQDPPTPSTPSSVRLYEKNTNLAVRADGASFYLCRCIAPVMNTQKRFKVRWFEIEQTPDLYRLAYEDRVELECVIGPAHLQRAKGGLLRLTAPELARIEQLIKAAEKGEDVTKLDPELFKPQTQTVKAAASKAAAEKKDEDKDNNDDTDVEPENEEAEPTPKRRRRGAAAKEATPKEKKPARKARTPKSDTPKAEKTPKAPKAKGSGKKASPKGGKRRMNKVVSIAQAAPSMRRTATMQLASATLQRPSSFFKRPSLMRRISLQKWPSLKVKPKRVKREPGAPRPKPDPNKKLKHNPRVTVWEKDPLFETRQEVPFVSSLMHSRLAIRAAKLGDAELLKEVIADTEQVHKVNIARSCHSEMTTLDYALLSEKTELIKLLMDDHTKSYSRVSEPTNLIKTEGTGTYNPRTLPGVKAVRKLKMSRGGREGNNALVKDRTKSYSPSIYISVEKALERNVSYETIKYLEDFNHISKDYVFGHIVKAVHFGHRKLAAKIVEQAIKAETYGFNWMHAESLKFENDEDFTGKMLEASILKCPYANERMRPIHCAAINPNPKYLTKMMAICANWDVEDEAKWRPIHYAAACEGTGPLKLLIKKGVSLTEGDKNGLTPLIVACIAGRSDNVKVILDYFLEQEKEDAKELGEDAKPNKFGPGGINKPMKNTWCPIHYATSYSRKDVIKVLLDYGADINKNVGANYNRITPLLMASQDGDLDFVKFLIENGAKIEKPDKLKRTALIHAVRDGSATVASYLLNRGADPNTADSSGNTALHYAAAYGWYFCVKVLLDAGANPDPANDWKMTPLGASFLKGNHGLTKVFMEIPGVNIDFQDDEGKTLLHHTLTAFPCDKKTVAAVKLLVIEKKAKVNLLDKQQRSCIYYMFENALPTENSFRYNNQHMNWEEVKTEMMAAQKEIVDILMDNGCDPWLGPSIFYTAFDHSEGARPLDALKQVMARKPWLPEITDDESRSTLLQYLTERLDDKEKLDMLTSMSKTEVDGRSGMEDLRKMARMKRNKEGGETPLIEACKYYSKRTKWWQEAEDDYQTAKSRCRELIRFLIEDLKSEMEYTWKRDKKSEPLRFTVLSTLLNSDDAYKAFDMVFAYKPNIDFQIDNGRTLLMEKVRCGDRNAVNKLLKCGANVNLKSEGKDDGHMTPLLLCLSAGQMKIVNTLLLKGADRNAIHETTKETVFHLAIKHCSDKIMTLKLLLTKDSSINCQDKNLRTPLHLVINMSTDSPDESKKLEHFMLKNGADPFIKDVRGRMPIHYLFVKVGRHTVKSSTDPVESYSILSMAMKNQKLEEPDKFGQTPLHRAAYRGATVCAMLLIQRGCNLNAKDNDGNTPMGFAVYNRHESCALMMMQKGADINADIINKPDADVHPDILAKRKEAEGKPNQNGPVSNSIANHTSETDSDEDPDYEPDSCRCETESDGSECDDPILGDSDSDESEPRQTKPITQVIRKNIRKIKNKPVWKHSLRHYPKPWMPGKRGYPILQGLVINNWTGLTFMAMDLLEPFGMQYASAVEIAIDLGKFRFALNLMEKQLDNEKLKVKNDKGETLLHVLARQGSSGSLQHQIVDDLVKERGVSINEQDNDKFTALHHCVLTKNWQLASYLVENFKANLDLKDKYGRNVVAALIWCGGPRDLLKKLVQQGATTDVLVDYPPMSVLQQGYLPNVHIEDYHKVYKNKTISPLINAIIQHYPYEFIQVLLKKASPNFADSEGMTPLMHAVQSGDILMVKLLFTPKIDIESYVKKDTKKKENIRDCITEQKVATDDDLFAEVEPFPTPTSAVNVNAVDHAGRTALHHLLTTLPSGSYEDVHILKMLSDAKASLDVKDKEGRSLVDLALERKAVMMAKGLQSLMGVPKAEWRLPTFDSFVVDDNIKWDGPEYDFMEDAKKMLKEYEEEEARLAALQPRAVVDTAVGDTDDWEVVLDEEIDMHYDILMTKVDVKLGEFGLYNFYKMQVVHDAKKDLYMMINRWGRIGDTGQFQRTPFRSAKEATEEFAKIFKAKSGNEWKSIKSKSHMEDPPPAARAPSDLVSKEETEIGAGNLKQVFEVKPKRYRLIEADHRYTNKKVEAKYDLKTDLPSKLPPYVRDIMADLSNVTMLSGMMRNTGIDIPFGRLKKEMLIKAKELLLEIRDLAEKVEELECNLSTENIDEYRTVCEQVSELSSEYFYMVPVSGYKYEALKPLKSTYDVQRWLDKFEQLLELEFTGSILLGAQYRIKEINPYDYLYRAMKTRIQQLKEDSSECQNILQYILASCPGAEIEAIYRMERAGEPERLQNCNVNNRTLLWHGSRTSNLLSILSRGLLIAPKEAPVSGHAFGQGIYTADMFSKSQGYCYNDGDSKSRYMLLCEVALGKEHHVDNNRNLPDDLPPAGYNSVAADGSSIPNPRYTAMTPTGVKIPLGRNSTNYRPYAALAADDRYYNYNRRSLSYNEFIVYNQDQVCLRYIVQFR